MFKPHRIVPLFVGALALGTISVTTAAPAVTIDWVPVGDPGNAADTTGVGAVATVYRISKHEVTNTQYVEFLNAKAASDPNGLYNTSMGSASDGGITRSGSDGSYTYTAISGRGDMPVNYVSFWDTLRFANWLNNGQGSGDTETGAYTITAGGIAANSITRNVGATIFLTSDSEWYKAAFFDGTSYFDYPGGTDTQTVCAAPGATANTANCNFAVGDLTDVGSYTGAASPYGTFDQAGNVGEWNEAIPSSPTRRVRGSSYVSSPLNSNAGLPLALNATFEGGNVGFRVASQIPEPATALLMAAGLTALAAHRRRLH